MPCSIATRLGRPRVHTTLCLPHPSLPLKHVSSKADSWFICRWRYRNWHANSIATRIRILLSHVFYSVGLYRLFYSIRLLFTHCIREVLRVHSCGDAGAKWQRGRQRLWRPRLATVNARDTAYPIPHASLALELHTRRLIRPPFHLLELTQGDPLVTCHINSCHMNAGCNG